MNIIFLIFILILPSGILELNRKIPWKCADRNCAEPIYISKASLSETNSKKPFINFNKGDDVKILRVSEHRNEFPYYFGKVNNEAGLVKIDSVSSDSAKLNNLIRVSKEIFPEESKQNEETNLSAEKPDIKPAAPEVYDGTTILYESTTAAYTNGMKPSENTHGSSSRREESINKINSDVFPTIGREQKSEQIFPNGSSDSSEKIDHDNANENLVDNNKSNVITENLSPSEKLLQTKVANPEETNMVENKMKLNQLTSESSEKVPEVSVSTTSSNNIKNETNTTFVAGFQTSQPKGDLFNNTENITSTNLSNLSNKENAMVKGDKNISKPLTKEADSKKPDLKYENDSDAINFKGKGKNILDGTDMKSVENQQEALGDQKYSDVSSSQENSQDKLFSETPDKQNEVVGIEKSKDASSLPKNDSASKEIPHNHSEIEHIEKDNKISKPFTKEADSEKPDVKDKNGSDALNFKDKERNIPDGTDMKSVENQQEGLGDKKYSDASVPPKNEQNDVGVDKSKDASLPLVNVHDSSSKEIPENQAENMHIKDSDDSVPQENVRNKIPVEVAHNEKKVLDDEKSKEPFLDQENVHNKIPVEVAHNEKNVLDDEKSKEPFLDQENLNFSGGKPFTQQKTNGMKNLNKQSTPSSSSVYFYESQATGTSEISQPVGAIDTVLGVVDSLESPPMESLNENDKITAENIKENYFNDGSELPDNKELKEETAQTPEGIIESGPENEDGYLFSSLISMLSTYKDLFLSSDNTLKHPVSEINFNEESTKYDINNVIDSSNKNEGGSIRADSGNSNGFCERDICDDITPVDKSYHKSKDEEKSEGFFSLSSESLTLLFVTSVVVLLFSLGHYYIEKSRRDAVLVAKINNLEEELFVIKKEHSMLDDQLLDTNKKVTSIEQIIADKEMLVLELETQLHEMKESNLSLEETIARQEKEIETLMENGMEMHRLLSESMSDEERSQMLLSNIAELKESLTSHLNEIVTLTEELDAKKQEVQILQLDLKNSSDKQIDLEQKLANAHLGLEEKVVQSTEPLKHQIIRLEKVIEEKTVEQTSLEAELAKLKSRSELLSVRCEVAEKGLQEAHGVKSSEAFQKWAEVNEVRISLSNAEYCMASLKDELKQLYSDNQKIEDLFKSTVNKVAVLNEKYELAEKEKIEALTKLQVLSNYFKEKETQLQEELGLKESLWLQKQSEDHTIYEQMRSLREENLSYKSQNELLKQEILEQEASFKKQIANEAQKAHENWVALRQGERRLKEVQIEAGHLRNRLTAIESSSTLISEEKINPNGLEPNGDSPFPSAASPPFMMFPREFIPPPPLAHATPTRPPPLGRISSPPLPVDFTPPPPLLPYEMYPSPSPPPPPIIKPQPREGKREQKGSLSSNYSSESMPDKPISRSKR